MTMCPKCGKLMENRSLVVADSKEVFSLFKGEYVKKLIWNKLMQCPKCSRVEMEAVDL
jgi:uncharacterized C2H2 Zn-finger protein